MLISAFDRSLLRRLNSPQPPRMRGPGAPAPRPLPRPRIGALARWAGLEPLEPRALLSQGPYPGPAAPQLDPAGPPLVIQAENYDTGGEGVAYHDTTAANEGGGYRLSEAVDVKSNSASAGGGYRVSNTQAGEWLEYTFTLPPNDTYEAAQLAFLVSSNGGGGTFHAEIDGVDATGPLTAPNTGSWEKFVPVRSGLVGVAGTAGSAHVLRLVMDSLGPTGSVASFDAIRLRHPGDDDLYEEGNDTQAQVDAEPAGASYSPNLGPITASRRLDNLVAVAGDADWYRFELTAARNEDARVEVQPTEEGGPVGPVQLFRADGVTAVRPNAAGVLSLVNQPAGVYYVRVADTPSGYNLNIVAGGHPQSPYPGPFPHFIPGYPDRTTIEAEDFDFGGEGVSYHDTTAGNTGGANARPGSGVDLTANLDGGYRVSDTQPGEWLGYTVAPNSWQFPHQAEFVVSSSGVGGTFHLEVDGQNVTGPISVPDTGGWDKFVSLRTRAFSFAETSTNPVLRLVMDSAGPSGAVAGFDRFFLRDLDTDDEWEGPEGGQSASWGLPAGLPFSPNLGVIQGSRTVQGSGGASSGAALNTWYDDVDWFKFTLPTAGAAGSQIRINTNAVTPDLLRVYRADGSTLVGQATGQPSYSVSLAGQPAGDYFIRVGNGVEYTLTLEAAGDGQAPFPGPAAPALPATVQMENFDKGGAGVAYSDTTAGNAGGANYRPGEAVDLQAIAGGYQVSHVKAGEWLEYTIQAPQAGNYDFGFRVASAGVGGAFHLAVDGAAVAGGISVGNTGGWGALATVKKSEVWLTAGVHVIRVAMDANGGTGWVGNFDSFAISPTPPPPASTPDIAVLGGGVSIVNQDPTPAAADGTAFGSVARYAPGPTHAFTLRNDGAAPLTLGSITAPAGFYLDSNPAGLTLAPGATATLNVRLDTFSEGTRSGKIVIDTNDPDEDPFTFAVSASVVRGAFQQSGGTDGLVSINVGAYDANLARGGWAWSGDSSGMTVSPNLGGNINTSVATASPQLDYHINFTKTGVYYVWVRGTGLSKNDDSVHVGLDGVALASSDKIEGFGAAGNWSNRTADGVVATINVTTPGVHTLNVWMREDGFKLSGVVLTTNAAYVPSGAGPAWSTRVIA